MGEIRKTTVFGVVAVLLAVLALVTKPRVVEPDAFFDRGEQFFPEFQDPNAARSLEVIDFDDETGAAVPFKVTFKNNRWSIPSHNDYPADGKDRLAQTAAGIIQVTKDDFRSDLVSDHELCGVLDPLDETTASLSGRGQRVTIKGEGDKILADLIVGKPVGEDESVRFVRVPEQKRVYAAKFDVDISTEFVDWIEPDLLLLEQAEIGEVVIKDYSIDERTGSVNDRDTIELIKDDTDTWAAEGMRNNQEVNIGEMNKILTELDKLAIVGVRPKPEGLGASLKKMDDGTLQVTQRDLMALQSKGYFFSRDGELLSNEGEVQVALDDGVRYTLRFGEVVYGTNVSAAGSADEQGPGENRYLFISVGLDSDRWPEPPLPADMSFQAKADSLWTADDFSNKSLQTAHDTWQKNFASASQRRDELNQRFGNWYYVISQESFEKLRATRELLIRDKTG